MMNVITISIKIDKYLESENNYLIEENDNFLIEKSIKKYHKI